jgi:hypothetical protein
MEIIIYGRGIEVATGLNLESADITEYGFTDIESVQVIDANGEEVFASQVETFKTRRTYDLDFNDLDFVLIKRLTMQYSWKDINEWNPSLLEFFRSTYNTPAGDVEVINCMYDGKAADILTPCSLEGCEEWFNDSGQWYKK